jgi:ribonuclease-3
MAEHASRYNKLITKEVVQGILEKYGVVIRVRDIKLYVKAMTHVSYVIGDDSTKDKKEIKELRKQSQQLLELEGDAALRHVFAKYLCRRYPNTNEGFVSDLKIKLEERKALADFCKVVGLDEYILMSRMTEESGGRMSAKVLEDTFEAFIGALDIDQGFDAVVRPFMFNLIEHVVNFADYIMLRTNYKDELMKMYQALKWRNPIYEEIKKDPHTGIYTVCVMDNKGEPLAEGLGKQKTIAEQAAAQEAIRLLQQFKKQPKQPK